MCDGSVGYLEHSNVDSLVTTGLESLPGRHEAVRIDLVRSTHSSLPSNSLNDWS